MRSDGRGLHRVPTGDLAGVVDATAGHVSHAVNLGLGIDQPPETPGARPER